MNATIGRRERKEGLLRALLGSALALATVGLAGCGGSSGGGSNNSSGPGAPELQATSPDVGPFSGGTVVTLTGRNFTASGAGTNVVTFGGVPATSVAVLDDSTLTCRTPAGTPGMVVDVRVRNDLGTATLDDGYAYLVPAAAISDLNGDGVADVVVGAPLVDAGGLNAGAVYVFFGNAQNHAGVGSRTADQADVTLLGQAPGDQFGLSVAAGDVDGDGQDDLVVGAHRHDHLGVADAGAVYVFHGPLSSGTTLAAAQADAKVGGDVLVPGDRFGSSVAVGDLDGDGRMEVLVGAPGHDAGLGSTSPRIDAGCVYVITASGMSSGTAGAAASTAFDGQLANDCLGNGVGAGDFDGDGLADLVMAASDADPYLPPLMQDAGAVYVCMGGMGAGGSVASVQCLFTGEAVRDEFGSSVSCGDVDGDGLADLLVGAPLNDALGTNVGRVYLFPGAPGFAGAGAAQAARILSGQPTHDSFGLALTLGDVDGDGDEDIVVGAPKADSGAADAGRTYVFLGGANGPDGVASLADLRFTGEANAGDNLGSLVRVVDANGDGLADLVVSAPGNDAGGAGAGRVYVFEGGQFLGNLPASAAAAVLTGSEAGGMFGSSVAEGQ